MKKIAKSKNKLIGMGIFTAIAASLCCITPVLAIILGTSGMAATFSWLEPVRPYLIGITILLIGFIWYQKLKPSSINNCNCENDKNSSFWKSNLFLFIITIFSVLILLFPNYSSIFFSEGETKTINFENTNISEVTITVKGMTCIACEHSVNNALSELEGVFNSSASFYEENVIIQYDKSKINLNGLSEAIEYKTGYRVID